MRLNINFLIRSLRNKFLNKKEIIFLSYIIDNIVII